MLMEMDGDKKKEVIVIKRQRKEERETCITHETGINENNNMKKNVRQQFCVLYHDDGY